MLYYVSGKVALLEPGLAVIDCGGVGYGCRVTAYTASQLKLNQNAKLFVTESIREDAFDLYGFSTREERRCFELLLSVGGVGPKAALAVLSVTSPESFTLAVMTGDDKTLQQAPGVGKKMAQRMILELKDKLGGLTEGGVISVGAAAAPAPETGNKVALASAALAELGYTASEISAVMKGIPAQELPVEETVRRCLRAMVSQA